MTDATQEKFAGFIVDLRAIATTFIAFAIAIAKLMH